MEKTKSSPDEILEAINREERSAHRGKLKIFFGYAAGVGKTYAMLEAAHTAQADGADIVAGYVEPHPRPQTAALLDGLEILPYKTIDYNGITLNEFDLDAAIKRSPQIILVDELAHSNAAGCRHTKRYQDVEELLNAGIDVWTTVNVQHIESLNDMVASITGVTVRERIPDKVFDNADKVELDSFENSVVLSIIGELALALENLRNIKEKEDAAVLAKNEQLRANLLRSISHDLRTPLTSISGNAGILVAESDSIDPEKRTKIYKSIYDDSLWLINLVENLLSVTRIEDGTMKIRRRSELMEEVIGEAVSRIRATSGRKITVHQDDELLMVKIDARLIVQVVINILDNAVKYSPADTEITVNVFRRGDNAVTEISDLGHGIPDADKPRIFDMFYTAETKIADSRRSMGLGLALCKSILAAHGGEITVRDNRPAGTVFSFTLPAEEVTIHE